LSDISTFNKKDVNGYIWQLLQAKGSRLESSKPINIPLTLFSGVALNIALKYNYELPVISDVKFNVYIKEVAQLAGITSMEKIRRLVGKRPVEILEPKYKFISSHTARRTFITIALQNGVPPVTIMKITGHKDLRTLMKYEFIDESAVIEAFSGLELAAPAIKKAV
jgi:integrase